MAEQELVEYIKKARAAGQSDGQSRSLLYKNGWTETEITDAFNGVNQPQVKPQQQQPQSQVSRAQEQVYQPQTQQQPQVEKQPEPQQQPEVKPQQQPQVQQQAQAKYQPQPKQSNMPRRGGTHIVLKLIIILILLAIIGAGVYFAIVQTNFLSYFSPKTIAPEVVNEEKTQEPASVQQTLSTVNLITVPQEYDITKMTVFAFSKTGDKVVYCAPKKVGNTISCFSNGQVLASPYSYRPSWAGFSPDGKRLVFLYLDPATKQSFIFENGKEGTRYDGTISGLGFSNDSQSFMYIVNGTDKKSFVVLNGNSGVKHDKIYGTPSLSNDGKYILYGARDGQDLFWVADLVTNANTSP